MHREIETIRLTVKRVCVRTNTDCESMLAECKPENNFHCTTMILCSLMYEFTKASDQASQSKNPTTFFYINSDTERVINVKKEKEHMRTSYAATFHDCNKMINGQKVR